MNKLTELQETRGKFKTEFLDLDAKVQAGTASADEAQRFGVLIDTEIPNIDKQIKQAEDAEALRGRFNKTTGVAARIGGSTDNEDQIKKRFSYTRMIDTLANRKSLDGVEAEITQEGKNEAKRAGIDSMIQGVAIPAFISGNDARSHELYNEIKKTAPHLIEMAQRALTTSTGDTAKAGYLIQTNLLVNQFIDVFRNTMVLDKLGVTMLMDLVGNIAIPKKTTSSTGGWLAEAGAITLDNTVFGQVTMSPKRVGNGVAYTKTLLRQTSMDVERLILTDMAQAIARIIQLGFLSGSGSSNQPTGLSTALVAASTNLVAMGTNGLAPTWAKIVEMESAVADDNADTGNLGYLFNAVTRGKLKTTEKTATSTAQFIWENGNVVNGNNAAVSNSLRSNLTKGSSSGVCSEAFFGNWSEGMIGQWGTIDIVVDPYTSAGSNTTNVYYNAFMDVAFRRLASFSYLPDILTT